MIRIRPAAPEDVSVLESLIPASVRALSAGYYSARQVESALRHLFGVDSQLIADGTYFVAEAEGALVGCGGWSRRRTLFGGDRWKAGDDPLLDPAREAGRIRAFFVHPGWARRGIGRRIMQVCEEAARTEGFRRLELVATLPGEPLYAAMGYRSVEPRLIRLSDGETLPAVRMEKALEAVP